MSAEYTTAEVAVACGVTVATIRKWKARGDLPNAPKGRQGQGRGRECYWSESQRQEAIARASEPRTTGHRRVLATNEPDAAKREGL